MGKSSLNITLFSLLFTGNVPRGVFCEQSSQKTRELRREIMRMHDFCASRSALLWTEWTVTQGYVSRKNSIFREIREISAEKIAPRRAAQAERPLRPMRLPHRPERRTNVSGIRSGFVNDWKTATPRPCASLSRHPKNSIYERFFTFFSPKTIIFWFLILNFQLIRNFAGRSGVIHGKGNAS